jgi:predicted phage terminase large subunit-like protein
VRHGGRRNPLAHAADMLEHGEYRQFATPGDLAAYLDPRTNQTTALDLLDAHLVKTADRAIDRLIWTMPPQEGKSVRISRTFPLWLLLRNPNLRIAIISYEARIARRWGRAIRNEINSHPELGLTVRRDTSAADEWQLEGHDGGIITAGIGGALTGRPVDVLIIDDPVKGRAEADSETYRETAWEFWTETASTRLAPGAPVVLLMTRWHEDDLAGRLLTSESADEWVHVNIPALADHDPDKGETDPLGRAPGEWLASARRRTVKQWERIRRQVGARAFAALYQGRPSPGEGGILKRAWWKYYDRPRAVRRSDGSMHALGVDRVIMSLDASFKDTKTSDWCVIQIWGARGSRAWLLHQVRDRMDLPALIAAVRSLAAEWPQATAKLIEEKANGSALIQSLRGEIGGLIPVNPTDSKSARAAAVSPYIQAGDIEIPDPRIAPWIGAFVEECSAFPNGRNDDQVDAMTQALARLVASGNAADDFMRGLLSDPEDDDD